jgi:hypothetical protein
MAKEPKMIGPTGDSSLNTRTAGKAIEPASAGSGKRKISNNGKDDSILEEKDRKHKLLKENQDLEEEIMRLRLIKEQRRLKEELKQLQDEIEGGDGGREEQWRRERTYSRDSDGRREASRQAALLMSPPLTNNSSIPSMDRLQDRDESDRESWWKSRTT